MGSEKVTIDYGYFAGCFLFICSMLILYVSVYLVVCLGVKNNVKYAKFCIWILTEIPTFLLSEPIIYIIGILLFGYVVSIVFKTY